MEREIILISYGQWEIVKEFVSNMKPFVRRLIGVNTRAVIV